MVCEGKFFTYDEVFSDFSNICRCRELALAAVDRVRSWCCIRSCMWSWGGRCPSEHTDLAWGTTALLTCHVSSPRLELFSRYVSQECKGDGESGFPADQRGFGVDHQPGRLRRPGGEEETSSAKADPASSPPLLQEQLGCSKLVPWVVRGWAPLAPPDTGLSAARAGGHFKPSLIAI